MNEDLGWVNWGLGESKRFTLWLLSPHGKSDNMLRKECHVIQHDTYLNVYHYYPGNVENNMRVSISKEEFDYMITHVDELLMEGLM